MEQELFNLVSLIVMCVGFVLGLLSLLFVYRQLVSNQRTREADVMIRLFEIGSGNPLANDFDEVWKLTKDEGNLDPKEQEAVSLRVCLFFEFVGALVSQRYISTILIEEYYGSLITLCYRTLSMYIEERRKGIYSDKFALNFEELAKKIERSNRVSRAPAQHPGRGKEPPHRKPH